MTNTGSAPAGDRVGAMGNLRPQAHRQFRFTPVPLPREQPLAEEWRELMAKFYRS